MSDVTRLKNRARREEQRENWSRAIELYTEALSESQKRADSISDVSLYNRIGDIYLRIGQKNTAVRYYEEAIERYAEHELHASAIALCNKVLRIHKGRSSIFLQLGRLHLATNLVADAHAHYLRYAESMRELGDDDAALSGLEELIEQTGDAKTVRLWTDYLASAIELGVAETRVEAFRGHLETHGFDPDGIMATIREAECGPGAAASPGVEAADPDSDTVVGGQVPPLPLLDGGTGGADVVSPSAVEPPPDPEEPPEKLVEEEGSIWAEESAILDELGSAVEEASKVGAPPGNELGFAPDAEPAGFSVRESAPWEPGEETAEGGQAELQESVAGQAPTGEATPESGEVFSLAEAIGAWSEPFLDGVEPPSRGPHSVTDAPGFGSGDACEASVSAPHEEEILLVASSDGIEQSIELEPDLALLGGYGVEIPEQPGGDPGTDLPRMPGSQLDRSESRVASAPPWVGRGPSRDRAERWIREIPTAPVQRAPGNEPCEVAEDVVAWVQPMPFDAETGDGPAVGGLAFGPSARHGWLAAQDAPESLDNLQETAKGGISWEPEPADVDLPAMRAPGRLGEPELTAAVDPAERLDAAGPPPESIEPWKAETDSTTELEEGLEQVLAGHSAAPDERETPTVTPEDPVPCQGEIADPVSEARKVEEPVPDDTLAAAGEVLDADAGPDALLDADHTEEPVSETIEGPRSDPEDVAGAESFPLEAYEYELDEAGGEDPEAGTLEVEAAAAEPDLEVVDFDPAVSEFEVEIPECPPEARQPEREQPSTAIAQEAPAREGEGENAFREWVDSASAPILRRALTELELRAELDKVLLVVERLLELDAGDPDLHRKRVEYVAALGNEPLLVAAYTDLGLCLEQAGEMLEAHAAYEDLSRIDPGNVAAASALQRLEGVVGHGAQHEEAANPADPMDDMRERAAMGGGSSTSGYMHPDLVRGGVLDAATGEGPRPYSGVSGGRDAGADFEQLLSEFRQELHEQPHKANSLTRTELGANLKAMGRIDDAIRELQAAVREPEAPALAYELLGEAFLDKGQARVAMRLLKQALDERSWDDGQMLGVLYQLGVSYQELNELPSALGCYERIFSVDIDYRDVQERILRCS